MAEPNERERIREKLVDCFMNDLEKMIVTQKDKWVIYTSSSKKPYGFYDSFMAARAEASVEFGFTSDFLIRQVSKDYQIYGRNGKQYRTRKRNT